MWLVRCGKTTNETFKWEDLQLDLQDAHRTKHSISRKKSVKVKLPSNIYNRGFFRNLTEVMYPLSSRPVHGFKEAREVGGALLCFSQVMPAKIVPDAMLVTDSASSEGDEALDARHLHVD